MVPYALMASGELDAAKEIMQIIHGKQLALYLCFKISMCIASCRSYILSNQNKGASRVYIGV